MPTAADPDALLPSAADHREMTYAVVWRENEGSDYSGRLELGRDGVELWGWKPGRRRTHLELRYEDLATLSLERARALRTTQPMLVLETRDRSRIEIVSLEGLGALHELAEQVAGARGKSAT
jgi:hypothetical protein